MKAETGSREALHLHHGGLMRCCIASFLEWVSEAPQKQVHAGEVIACRYEGKDAIRVDDDCKTARWIGAPP